MESNEKNIKIIESLLQECDEDTVVNRLVYKIPKKYLDFIKVNGYKFSEFVNSAIEEKINKLQGIDSGKK